MGSVTDEFVGWPVGRVVGTFVGALVGCNEFNAYCRLDID
jgi:hypothetical protein